MFTHLHSLHSLMKHVNTAGYVPLALREDYAACMASEDSYL